MTDYSSSNLGGIRNRHVPADASPAVRDTVRSIEQFERANGVTVTGITTEPDGRTSVRIAMPDGPPKRRKRDREIVQLEVPGAERPRILPLDDGVRDFLIIEEEIAALKIRRTSAQLTIQNLLVEHGCAVYVYVDGEFEWPVRMTATEKLVVKKRKRRTEEDKKHDTNDGQRPEGRG